MDYGDAYEDGSGDEDAGDGTLARKPGAGEDSLRQLALECPTPLEACHMWSGRSGPKAHGAELTTCGVYNSAANFEPRSGP